MICHAKELAHYAQASLVHIKSQHIIIIIMLFQLLLSWYRQKFAIIHVTSMGLKLVYDCLFYQLFVFGRRTK